MLGVEEAFPEFNLKSMSPGNIDSLNVDNIFCNLINLTYKGKCFVIFFYPQDFVLAYQIEIEDFGSIYQQFQERNVEVIGSKTDGEFVHWAWCKQQQELRNLPFPLIVDVKHQLYSNLGILDKVKGITQHDTFIIDLTQGNTSC